MPIACTTDGSLCENVFIEMPESVEALPRSVPYQNGVKQNHPENFPDMHLEPKHRSDDGMHANWRDVLTNGKWPYVTPLFFKAEEDTVSTLQEQARNLDNFNRSSTTIDSSHWDGTIHDIWSGSQRNVNEAFDIESSDQTDDNKPTRCEKACRRFLFAFLGLSILGAILAGVGLTLILTSYKRDSLMQYRKGYVDPGLSTQEMQYLTQTFCDLAKTMLKGVDFPTESGIESCHTTLRLLKESESLHIELQISPKEGFTIKEKFRRALTEEIITEGAYRINGSGKCLYVGRKTKRITCDGTNGNERDTAQYFDNTTVTDIVKPTSNLAERNQILTKQLVENSRTKHRNIDIDLRSNTGKDIGPQAKHGSNIQGLNINTNDDVSSVTKETFTKMIQPSAVNLRGSSGFSLDPSYNEFSTTMSPSTEIILESSFLDIKKQSSDSWTPDRESVISKPSSDLLTETFSVFIDDYSKYSSSVMTDSSPLSTTSLLALSSFKITNSSDWFHFDSDQIKSTPSPVSQRISNYRKDVSLSSPATELHSETIEVVTNKTRFETQTKNNTVATEGLTKETSADVSTHAEELTTKASVLEKVNFPKKLTRDTTRNAVHPTTNGVLLNDLPKELSGLGEKELIWRLNLYGSSKSKNYLRFPIVTGSNGKFLFSPLSNKDSIDISAKSGLTDNKPLKKVKVASNAPAVTKIQIVNKKATADKIEGPRNEGKLKGKPKPMVVDWKTPPIARPTNLPSGWEILGDISNASISNSQPVESSAAFIIPRINQANFV